ncbi:hypothetical protein BS78_10G146500 [Paspalum vaginatum]|nr:hypothetical protein BS78_10G146500 [Paspalum vaginatum]
MDPPRRHHPARCAHARKPRRLLQLPRAPTPEMVTRHHPRTHAPAIRVPAPTPRPHHASVTSPRSAAISRLLPPSRSPLACRSRHITCTPAHPASAPPPRPLPAAPPRPQVAAWACRLPGRKTGVGVDSPMKELPLAEGRAVPLYGVRTADPPQHGSSHALLSPRLSPARSLASSSPRA